MSSTPALSQSSMLRSGTSQSVARISGTRTAAYSNATSTPFSTRPSRASSATGRRSKTASRFGDEDPHIIICAVCEGRGVTPTVGIAIVNLTTGEATISQLCDNQFYARTVHKIRVFEPSEVLIVSSGATPSSRTSIFDVIKENIKDPNIKVLSFDRKYFSESAGLEYINQLAFLEEHTPLRLAVEGNFYAVCSFSAALKYINMDHQKSFAPNSLRIKYQPSEGTLMIDMSTMHALELIQNIQNPKSKASLFGLMNETLTPMGRRLLRSCILQPTTQTDVLTQRYDALSELSRKEDMFCQIRQTLRPLLDIEKLLSKIVIIPIKLELTRAEQSINEILMLKSFVESIVPLYEALTGAECEILMKIRQNFLPQTIDLTLQHIRAVINHDVTYQKAPLDLRNQRTYAVKAGVNGLLDVARQSFKETTEDVHHHVSKLYRDYDVKVETKFETARCYYLKIAETELEGRQIPDILINRVRKKGYMECQTLLLLQLNQKIEAAQQEVILKSDDTILGLLDSIRGEASSLYRICESVALLDMIAGLVQLATTSEDYVRPDIDDTLAIKAARHPVKEKMKNTQVFIPNDVFAGSMQRFQIITGCNMSGKSTYLRTVALMSVMAQVGSFVPASYASFPILHQLFARVSIDDSIESNMSTFAAEMRETAFILRYDDALAINIDRKSMAIIDELGRGTSTRDGLAIALSIAEALVESKAIVFFATHFSELAQILNERAGVVNLHLAVELKENAVSMLYKLRKGHVQEKHYGLALARVMNLPPKVLELAEHVSTTLENQIEAKKKSPRALAINQRNKLFLHLKAKLEELTQGSYTENQLRGFLQKLQAEFILRLDAIDGVIADYDDDKRATEKASENDESTSKDVGLVDVLGSDSEDDQSMLI